MLFIVYFEYMELILMLDLIFLNNVSKSRLFQDLGGRREIKYMRETSSTVPAIEAL
jgi:hypothetical protein